MERVGCMNPENFFFLDDSPIYKGKYLIRLNHDKFLFPNATRGSFGVFASRVMNMSYATYLRFCRDELGAELIGKNHKYVVPYFEKTPEVKVFIKLLNSRMRYIMHEHNYPYDYKEDKDGNIIRIPFNEENESNE